MRPSLLFAICLVCSVFISSQVCGQSEISLRIETGYGIHYSSYRPSIFISKDMFRPWPKDFYSLVRANDYSYYPNIALGIEGKFGKQHCLYIGYQIPEDIELKFVYSFCLPIPIPSDTIYYVRTSNTYNGLMTLNYSKIMTMYSFAPNGTRNDEKNRISVAPLVGLNILIPHNNWYDGQKIYSADLHIRDIYPDGSIDTVASLTLDSWIENSNIQWVIMGGMSFSLRKSNSDQISMRIYYQQGFSVIQTHQFKFVRKKEVYIENLYLFGSALCFQLSYPIRLGKGSKLANRKN